VIDETHSRLENSGENDLKEIMRTLVRHKISIIVLSIFFTVGAALFSYFKPDIYSTEVSMELSAKGSDILSTDIMAQALGDSGANLSNEIMIIQSRFLASKALDYLDIGTRYFTKKNLREVELYKNSPFIVSSSYLDKKLYGRKFSVIPIDSERFKLQLDTPGGLKNWIMNLLRSYNILPQIDIKPITHSGIHYYNEEIVTPWFKLTLQKLYDPTLPEYSFSIVPNKDMWGFIQGKVKASATDGSIVKIKIEDTNPLRAQEIANSIAHSYLNQEIELKTSEADQTLMFIDEQLEAINKTLQSSQSKLEDFRKSNIVVDISQTASLTSSKMSQYESKIQELEIEESVLSNLQQYINNNQDISGITLGSAAFTDPALSQLILNLQDAARKKKTLLIEFTELHPDVLKLTEGINSMKASIRFTIKNDLSAISERKRSLKKIIKNYEKSLSRLPTQERKLANLTRKSMVNEKIYGYLLERRAETAILSSSTVSKTRIIDDALLPDSPIKPKRILIVIVGFVLGLVVGIALAFLRELLDDTVKSAEEIERLTTIPLYGAIPLIKGKKYTSAFLESFRVLRTNLEFIPIGKKYQTIVVTSSVSGEGKTTITTNLGIILGKGDKKVIILDLDLRRAQLSHHFGLSNRIGLSTHLSGKHTLDEVIQRTDEKGLSIIAAGPTPPNPSELIMSAKAEELVEKLRKIYDYIIFDTPPAGLVTDAMILMNKADVSLMVVKANYSKKDFIKGLNRMIGDFNIKHVGIVVNGVDLGGSYGHGYGYGGYGSEKYYTD
jgi:capsular exopolysaccharide synthesis family protein